MLRSPPLTALKAFEAAARHMSFSAAAEEIGVTPSALSFQIKNLEEHLGTKVFKRLNRSVELTEAGRVLYPGLRDGLERLQQAWQAAVRSLDSTRLVVTAGPAFTARWLAPRLLSFAQDHPDIDLQISSTLRSADFTRDEVDVAIRFGPESDKGLYAEDLLVDWVAPMAHPSLAEGLMSPTDLTRTTLIHDDSLKIVGIKAAWQDWARAVGMELDTSKGLHFSQAHHGIDLAVSGAGVVLGRYSMAYQNLLDGTLVLPFKTGLSLDHQFRFICRKQDIERPVVAQFRDWLKAEIAETVSSKIVQRMILV